MKESQIRICNVEDDQAQYRLLKMAFEKMPFKCSLVHFLSGELFLEKDIKNEFDIILLDYKLPGMNGVEIIKEVRNRGISTPIILLSAFGSEQVIAEALEMGADDFMVKDPSRNYLKVLSFMITKTIKKAKLQQEHTKLQQEILYAQRAQSISTLAQGIAHDFNNALVGIIGYSELLMLKLDKNHETYSYTAKIDKAAKRMATWVKQLLAYSKSATQELKPLDVNSIIHNCIMIVNPSLEKRIQIFTSFDQDLKKVKTDSNQIEQVITNILLNSIESISGKGEIRIITANVSGMPFKSHLKKTYNSYIRLIIEDNGMGMDEVTKTRIFDPFFSTKFIGRGLGMAAVYGIIENHDGYISVQSEPSVGTTIEIYLPAYEADSDNVAQNKPMKKKSKSILVVDDEQVTIEVINKVFQERNYNILIARDGAEALDVFKKHPDISVVLLDLIIPKKDGVEVYYEMKKIKPDQKIIICTGSERDCSAKLLENGADGLIQKPFSIQDLIYKVESVIKN